MTTVLVATPDPLCARCKVPAAPWRHLVSAYWDPAKRYCSSCCGILAAEFDRNNTWPSAPQGDLP